MGTESAGFLSRITFSWVWPLLQRGKQCSIAEDTASAFVREDTRAPRLAADFDAVFDRLRVRAALVWPPLSAEAWCPEMPSCPLCISTLLSACMHDAVWRAHACMTICGVPVSSLLSTAGRYMEWCRSSRIARVWHPTCPTPTQEQDPGNDSNLLLRAMLRLYWPRLSLQSFWTLCEVGIRCALHLPPMPPQLHLFALPGMLITVVIYKLHGVTACQENSMFRQAGEAAAHDLSSMLHGGSAVPPSGRSCPPAGRGLVAHLGRMKRGVQAELRVEVRGWLLGEVAAGWCIEEGQLRLV